MKKEDKSFRLIRDYNSPTDAIPKGTVLYESNWLKRFPMITGCIAFPEWFQLEDDPEPRTEPRPTDDRLRLILSNLRGNTHDIPLAMNEINELFYSEPKVSDEEKVCFAKGIRFWTDVFRHEGRPIYTIPEEAKEALNHAKTFAEIRNIILYHSTHSHNNYADEVTTHITDYIGRNFYPIDKRNVLNHAKAFNDFRDIIKKGFPVKVDEKFYTVIAELMIDYILREFAIKKK